VVICDAGSTGTRLYVYHCPTCTDDERILPFPSASSSAPPMDVEIKEGDKVTPGISEQSPESVVRYLMPAIKKAKTVLVPSEFHSQTPLLVYATGGMRLLPDSQQALLWDALVRGLQQEAVPFIIHRDHFRTISGSDEAYLCGLAVNYLAGTLRSNLRRVTYFASKSDSATIRNKKLLGALDLGGASAQIVSYAPKTQQRLPDPNAPPVQRSDFYARSLLGYGFSPVMYKLDSYVSNQYGLEAPFGSMEATLTAAQPPLQLANPCYFRGYKKNHSDAANGTALLHVGSGDAYFCQRLIVAAIVTPRQKTNLHISSLLGDDISLLSGDYYATTLFYYTIDFVRTMLKEFLKRPPSPAVADEYQNLLEDLSAVSNPSMETISYAAHVACGWDYFVLLEHKEAYQALTSPQQLPNRCLALCYQIILLENMGFYRSKSTARVHFVHEIRNHTAEWTLGAFLDRITHGPLVDKPNKSFLRAYNKGKPSLGLPLKVAFMFLSLAGAVLYLLRRRLNILMWRSKSKASRK